MADEDAVDMDPPEVEESTEGDGEPKKDAEFEDEPQVEEEKVEYEHDAKYADFTLLQVITLA